MKAIYLHEIKNYFNTITAYIFGAFLLMFTGIGAMIYNINSAVSNFEYVLEFCCIILTVIIPVLTMRIIAEEKKQKTDQLLYSLPLTTTRVVVGKYLALLTVFIVPVLIISAYPLLFSRFGDVSLKTAYGTIAAFFIMGSSLIAVGEYISSLTDNQGMAAGIGIAVMLLNYFSVSLSEYVSSTAYSSLVTICIISVIIALIIKNLTGNVVVGAATGVSLCGAAVLTYLVDSTKLEGLLPSIMVKLSLFKRFSVFVNGLFDVSAVVYYISVTVLALFLTVQSLEKRRYN